MLTPTSRCTSVGPQLAGPSRPWSGLRGRHAPLRNRPSRSWITERWEPGALITTSSPSVPRADRSRGRRGARPRGRPRGPGHLHLHAVRPPRPAPKAVVLTRDVAPELPRAWLRRARHNRPGCDQRQDARRAPRRASPGASRWLGHHAPRQAPSGPRRGSAPEPPGAGRRRQHWTDRRDHGQPAPGTVQERRGRTGSVTPPGSRLPTGRWAAAPDRIAPLGMTHTCQRLGTREEKGA